MLPCAAAFGCLQPEQGSKAVITHYRPGWRSQRDDQTMPSSEAAFGCLQPEQGNETL